MKVDPSFPSILLLLLLLQETCKANLTFLKPIWLYERRLCSMKHETIISSTTSYNHNQRFKDYHITSLLIMREAQRLPSLQSMHLMKPWSGSSASLLQGTRTPSYATLEYDNIGKRYGGWESQFHHHNNAKVQFLSTSYILSWRVGFE